MSTVSPIFNELRYCDIFPPAGNLGCTFAKYTYIMETIGINHFV